MAQYTAVKFAALPLGLFIGGAIAYSPSAEACGEEATHTFSCAGFCGDESYPYKGSCSGGGGTNGYTLSHWHCDGCYFAGGGFYLQHYYPNQSCSCSGGGGSL
jgi:hypothetical protein